MAQKYRWMTEEEFRSIKPGDIFLCEMDGCLLEEMAISSPFYNYDTSEPGWEIDTKNGTFSQDCAWVEIDPDPELRNRISNTLETELSRIYDEQGITSGDVTPEQYLAWERLTGDLAKLFTELIEQNKPL